MEKKIGVIGSAGLYNAVLEHAALVSANTTQEGIVTVHTDRLPTKENAEDVMQQVEGEMTPSTFNLENSIEYVGVNRYKQMKVYEVPDMANTIYTKTRKPNKGIRIGSYNSKSKK